MKLSGEDGNAYSVISRARQALRKAGLREAATEFSQAAPGARSYGRTAR